MSRQKALITLKGNLLTRRKAIQDALQGDLSALHELTLATGELADVALDSAHEEVTSHMAEAESRELSKIEDAIKRINDGSYGACEGCSKPIPLARLQALPYATLCIKCQVKLEESGFEDWSELSAHAYDSV
jgi:DnaK suppressor protein